MDIERIEKLLESGIEAGNKVKAVREVVKTSKTQKQDMYDATSEILKPSIDVQKSIKETIDNKQDELIKQLQDNQNVSIKAIEGPVKKAIKGSEIRDTITIDANNKFTENEMEMLKDNNLITSNLLLNENDEMLQKLVAKTNNFNRDVGYDKREANRKIESVQNKIKKEKDREKSLN